MAMLQTNTTKPGRAFPVVVELTSNLQYILLAAFTLLAAFLRFYKIGEWSFYGDEIITVKASEYISDWPLTRLLIYLVLTRIALVLFGTSEWSARFFPALVGVLSIPAFYFPIRKILDREVALISALLLAISPWHLYWSQNARFYTLILLFYTISLLLFYLGLEQNNRWYLLLSIIFLVLAVRERFFSLFLYAIFALFTFLAKRNSDDQQFGHRFRIFLLLIITGMVILLFQGWQSIRGLFQHFNLYQGFEVNSPFWILGGILFYLGVPLICAGFIGMLYLFSQRNPAGRLFGLAATIPIATTVLLANFVYTGNRYAFVTLSSWIVLASVGIRELFRYLPGRARLLAAIPLLMLVLASLSENALYYLYQNGNRANWKAAFGMIQQRKQAGDLVATANKSLADYYLHEDTLDLADGDISKLSSQDARVWIVEDAIIADIFSGMHHWITEKAKFIADFDVQVASRNFRMKVFLYDPNWQ